MSAAHPEIDWRVMDIRALTFDDNSFDVAIDKATLDAMLYGSLWDPEDEVKENVRRYVDEVCVDDSCSSPTPPKRVCWNET